MLKKIALTTIATSALLITVNASALTGVYGNGQLGYATHSSNSTLNDGTTELSNRDQRNFAWNVMLGYNVDYDEMFSFAGEFGYGDYGQTSWKTNDSTAKLKAEQTAWLLLAVATYHFDEDMNAYFKAGAAFGKNDVISNDTGYTDSDGNHGSTRPMTVLGARFNIMPELAVSLEWQHIFGSKMTASNTNNFQTIDAGMLGLTYTFEV